MTSKITLPLIILSISAAIASLLILQKEPPRTVDSERPTMLVDVVRARSGSTQVVINAQGTVVPRTQTTMVSEVAGLITEVSPAFVAGGFFSKGDLLVRIDDRNYRAEVKRAEASVAAAQTKIDQETGLAEFAKTDWERARKLLNSSKAASDLALRKPQVLEAYAQLEFAKADLEKRQGDLDRTQIRAPYDGLVREKLADIGQFVNAGSPIAATFAVDVAEIRLPLPDKELPFLELDNVVFEAGEGPKVNVSAVIGGQVNFWDGRIVRTEGVFDEKSRVLYVVAQIGDPYNRLNSRWTQPLRMGTFVKARIAGSDLDDVVRLPRSVLRGNSRVWTVTDENTLKPVEVSIVRSDEKYVFIGSGLLDGQLICTTLLDNPLPGTPVRYELPAISGLGVSSSND
ncbi:MAG TPA: efflux transporter periplasmic adaptor subunit [Gammaproteobacteria bacterium]|nr:efflux transporter periplasmic adaptor subunit [Gammaproteobacteria bacterium]